MTIASAQNTGRQVFTASGGQTAADPEAPGRG